MMACGILRILRNLEETLGTGILELLLCILLCNVDFEENSS